MQQVDSQFLEFLGSPEFFINEHKETTLFNPISETPYETKTAVLRYKLFWKKFRRDATMNPISPKPRSIKEE